VPLITPLKLPGPLTVRAPEPTAIVPSVPFTPANACELPAKSRIVPVASCSEAADANEPPTPRATVPPWMSSRPVKAGLAPVSVNVPTPVLARLPEPVNAPPKLPAVEPTVRVPAAMSTVPEPVITASVWSPPSESVAPEATLGARLEASRPTAVVASVPAVTVRPPVKVLAPESVTVPLPVFSKMPAPLTTPDSVSEWLPLSKVALFARSIALASVRSAVVPRVTPLASIATVPVPKAASSPASSVPAERVVPPE